jgi:prevent-host-death family protein
VKVTVHEAKTQLSRLLQKVECGEEVIVCRGRQPVARLVAVGETAPKNPPVGVPTSESFEIPDDAFAPLTAETLKRWGL